MPTSGRPLPARLLTRRCISGPETEIGPRAEGTRGAFIRPGAQIRYGRIRLLRPERPGITKGDRAGSDSGVGTYRDAVEAAAVSVRVKVRQVRQGCVPYRLRVHENPLGQSVFPFPPRLAACIPLGRLQNTPN